MEIPGRVQNGVVVLDGGPVLPEGTSVAVVCPDPQPVQSAIQRRVELPLVRSAHPGNVHLTAERVAELLDAEDVPA